MVNWKLNVNNFVHIPDWSLLYWPVMTYGCIILGTTYSFKTENCISRQHQHFYCIIMYSSIYIPSSTCACNTPPSFDWDQKHFLWWPQIMWRPHQLIFRQQDNYIWWICNQIIFSRLSSSDLILYIDNLWITLTRAEIS